MDKFERSLSEIMKSEEEISPTVREKYDETYTYLRSNKSVHPKKLKFKRYGIISLVAILVISFSGLIFFTDAGEALVNLLKFDQFSTKTLKDGNLVSKPKTTDTLDTAKITLDEIYNDQKEIGILLTISLPKNSPLLNTEFTDYGLNFALADTNGKYVADLNSKLRKNGEEVATTGSITVENTLNKEENELLFRIKIANSSNRIFDLSKGTVMVTKVFGYKRNTETGFHDGKNSLSDEIDGNWSLNISKSNLKEYETIDFKPIDKKYNGKIYGVAYPTAFVLSVVNPSNFDGNGDPLDNYISDGNIKYTADRLDTIEENGNKVLQITFNYAKYDENKKIKVRYQGVNFEMEMN